MLISCIFGLLLFVVGCLGECTLESTFYTYSQASGHFYSPIKCINDSWEGAYAFAKTLSHPEFGQGYLWEINSFEERRTLSSSLLWPSYADNFVGGKDATGTNKWYWTGPASDVSFYNPLNGCTQYCNFNVNYPKPSAPSAQGLRLRISDGPGWIAASTTEIVGEAWAFVEYGCCDCGNRGRCNQTTCQCDCGDSYVGPHCEVYIGGCKYPGAPICEPVTPVCVKPSAPTDAPTGSSDASTGSSDAPTGSSDASNGSSDASTGSSDASNGSSEASTGSSDASTGSSDAPTEPPAICEAAITPVAREQSSYEVSGGVGVEYDILVINTGGQVATRVYFDVIIPPTSYIVEWWQFARMPPTYIDLPNLAVGDSYSLGGFRIEDYSSSWISVSFEYNYTVC